VAYRDSHSTIAGRLRHLIATQRQPNGRAYTTRQIAQAAGCSHGHIADIVSGKVTSPHVDTLVSIAEFFGRDPAYLIPRSRAGFDGAADDVAQIAFRASRLDRESLLGVQNLINQILAGEIKPDNPRPGNA